MAIPGAVAAQSGFEEARFVFIVVAVVVSLINGLIIRLLTSRRIREEFDADG